MDCFSSPHSIVEECPTDTLALLLKLLHQFLGLDLKRHYHLGYARPMKLLHCHPQLLLRKIGLLYEVLPPAIFFRIGMNPSARLCCWPLTFLILLLLG